MSLIVTAKGLKYDKYNNFVKIVPEKQMLSRKSDYHALVKQIKSMTEKIGRNKYTSQDVHSNGTVGKHSKI